MNLAPYLWIATAAIWFILVYWAIRSRHTSAYRGLTTIAFPLVLIATWAYGQAFLGLPDPSEIKDKEAIHVFHGVIVPNVAIYIWADVDGVPHSYVLPYSEEQANQLQKAMDDKQAGTGGPIMMKDEEGNQYNPGERKFYSEPVQPGAPK